MKKTIITTVLALLSIGLSAQDQTINGNLTVNKTLTVGTQGTPSSSGSVNRIIITPYGHTGRWDIIARDNSSDAFLDIFYGTNKIITFNHRNRIGILTQNPTCALDVAGTIRAKEVKIEATGWADFVFDRDYKLPGLSEVETHIKEKGTLPDIPSQEEVKENGIDLGEMQVKLLQKIEELTLYVIDQDKRIKALEEENKNLKNLQP